MTSAEVIEWFEDQLESAGFDLDRLDSEGYLEAIQQVQQDYGDIKTDIFLYGANKNSRQVKSHQSDIWGGWINGDDWSGFGGYQDIDSKLSDQDERFVKTFSEAIYGQVDATELEGLPDDVADIIDLEAEIAYSDRNKQELQKVYDGYVKDKEKQFVRDATDELKRYVQDTDANALPEDVETALQDIDMPTTRSGVINQLKKSYNQQRGNKVRRVEVTENRQSKWRNSSSGYKADFVNQYGSTASATRAIADQFDIPEDEAEEYANSLWTEE